MAVLHGWFFHPERISSLPRPDTKDFRMQTRDLYVPAGDTGFWQGAFRDPNEPIFGIARDACNARGSIAIDLMYGDYEGGQRMISRFGLTATPSGSWLAIVGRHWNLDRADPR